MELLERRRKTLEDLLNLAYDTKGKLERKLLLSQDPLEQAQIIDETERINKQIAIWEKELQALTHPYQHTIIPVRVFFILAPSCTSQLEALFLQQNQRQDLFELDIPRWESWHGRYASENTLQSFHTASRLEFCNKFQQEMNRYNQAVDGLNLARVNLAVTELPFPKNYYTWNTADRKGIVIGIHSLRFLFEEKQAVVNDIILLVAKRMLIYSLNIPDLRTHEATRGCIFDNTVYINHIQYAAANPGLCSVCRQIILEQKGPDLLETLTNWVERKNS